MRQLLLLALLLTGPLAAHAQLTQLIGLGLNTGLMMARNGNEAPDRADVLYVNTQNYQGQVFSQKRTPAAKQPKRAAAQITALERLLEDAYTALRADDVQPLFAPDWEARYTAALQAVTAAQPKWSVMAYENEAEFYRLVTERRQRALRKAAESGK